MKVRLQRRRSHATSPGGTPAPEWKRWRIHIRSRRAVAASRTGRKLVTLRNLLHSCHRQSEDKIQTYAEVREKAFAMPLNDPAYPRGPYKFYNREFVVITYRTDIDRLREVVPEPLEVAADTVAYRVHPHADSTGFGDYTETGQVIPVRFAGRAARCRKAATCTPCISTTTHRSLAGARSGAFQKSWPRRK